MAEFTHIQKSFSGGEISERMLMRDDLEAHAKSVLGMQNFMPTLQGSAVRTPGSRYIYTPTGNNVRIMPYYTPANERSILEITPGAMRIIGPDAVGSSQRIVKSGAGVNAIVSVYQQILDNYRFTGGYTGWDADPISFPSAIDGNALGWTYNRGDMLGTAREWGAEYVVCTLTSTCEIPEDTVEELILTPSVIYENNFSGIDAGYLFEMKVGTTEGGSEIWSDSFTEVDHQVGYSYNRTISTEPQPLTAGTTLYITINLTPVREDGEPSTPQFRIKQFGVYSLTQVDTGDGTVTGTIPYTAAELPDLQFVQSPYQEVSGDPPAVTGVGKELVITHPLHKPHWLRFDGAAYVFEPIVFNYLDDQGVDQAWEPIQWSEGNYPAACASFNGRLILAGSQKEPILGSPSGSCVETVWGTEVGEWSYFTDPNQEEVNPDDSLEFTTIFRSPIQWVYGQKNLLVGAREMEYVASADTIFQPADIGVSMQSTHGSSAVQPTGIGAGVLFPAEGGKKVRLMTESNENQGWVSPDLTLSHPELFASGIVRMVRMRNPHQMCIVVMGNGELAVLHMDQSAGVSGWSRINLNAVVKDACVVPDGNGADVLYVTVTRWVQGQPVTYVEAFDDWIDGGRWDYMQSSRLTRTLLNVAGGFDHLIGRNVQVIGDGDYLGVFTVDNAGEITLVDSIGEPIYVTAVLAGLSMPASMRTLPLVTSTPGSKKRYSKIKVRGLFSSRVRINGERVADRAPVTPQGNSQPVDPLIDIEVANMGWDATQTITIEENAPVRSELLGIFGTVKSNSV